MILDSRTLDLIVEDRRAKQYITDIKFHEGGHLVGGPGVGLVFAMLSIDGKIYIHDAVSFKLLRSISLPTRSRHLTRLDFSLDGSVLRVATQAEELIHLKTINGEIIISPVSIKDTPWLTYTCPNTWFTQGMFFYNSMVCYSMEVVA